jgi:phage portal protein BeeE
MTAAVLLRGNGFAPLLRDSRGRPQQWIPINPDRVIVLEAEISTAVVDRVATRPARRYRAAMVMHSGNRREAMN